MVTKYFCELYAVEIDWNSKQTDNFNRKTKNKVFKLSHKILPFCPKSNHNKVGKIPKQNDKRCEGKQSVGAKE